MEAVMEFQWDHFPEADGREITLWVWELWLLPSVPRLQARYESDLSRQNRSGLTADDSQLRLNVNVALNKKLQLEAMFLFPQFKRLSNDIIKQRNIVLISFAYFVFKENYLDFNFKKLNYCRIYIMLLD